MGEHVIGCKTEDDGLEEMGRDELVLSRPQLPAHPLEVMWVWDIWEDLKWLS